MSRQPKVTAEDYKLEVKVTELRPVDGREGEIFVTVRNRGRYRATYSFRFVDGSGLGYGLDPGDKIVLGPFGRWMIPDQVIREADRYDLIETKQTIPEGGPEDFRGRI